MNILYFSRLRCLFISLFVVTSLIFVISPSLVQAQGSVAEINEDIKITTGEYFTPLEEVEGEGSFGSEKGGIRLGLLMTIGFFLGGLIAMRKIKKEGIQ